MKIRTLYAASGLFLVLTLTANAQLTAERKALRGITTTSVYIEELSTDAQAAGLSVEQLKADVELRLRKAGVQLSEHSTSFLYVRVATLKSASCPGFYALHVDVELTRMGTLVFGKGTSADAAVTVWQHGNLTIQPSREFAATARHNVADLTDRFLNDYLAANPRP